MSIPTLYAHLVEDATTLDETVAAPDAVRDHLALTDTWQGEVAGPLVVTDRRLAEVARAVPAGSRARVLVINTSGAGGLLSLAERGLDPLQVVAVVSTLRDLGDLAGNARRVVAATEVLDPEVVVHVGLPRAPGWDRAAEEVEAAGLRASIDLSPAGGPNAPDALAGQLRDLVELDLPFRVSGIAADLINLPSLLVTVESLVEDAGVEAAARLLGAGADTAVTTIMNWDEAAMVRVRRRLLSVAGPPADRVIDELVVHGLVSEG